MRLITIAAAYSADLNLAIQWLHLNKAIKKIGPVQTNQGTYSAVLIPKHMFDKKKIKNLVKNKFGTFIKVL